MKKKEKLLKLFKIYSSNLTFHAPELENKFVCPICFRIFSEDAIESKDLTIEHIIPSSLGGSLLTLTCKDCNSLGGTLLDSHLVNRLRTEDLLAGKASSPLRGEFILGSERITADIYLSTTANPNIRIIGIPELSNPQKLQKINDEFDSGVQSFQIAGKLGYKDLPSRVSILKIAYLMAFSYFGYGYIKYPFLDFVRKQIMNSNEETEVLKGIVKLDFLPFEKSCLTVLEKPDNLQCFFVTLDLSTKVNRYVGVVLPGFNQENTGIYSQWKNTDYTNTALKSSSVKLVPYSEEFLLNEKYKYYAIEVWHIIQNQSER